MNNFQRNSENVFERAKIDEENKAMVVEGYALKFNKPTTIMAGTDFEHQEIIAKNSIDEDVLKDVVLNKNHDNNLLLARTTNNTLKLKVDNVGLKIKATIIDNQFGRDTFEEIKTGLIQKMSFAWSQNGSEWVWEEKNGKKQRTFTKLGKFFDVSAVTFPAYDDTGISNVERSGANGEDKNFEIEEIKREFAEKLENDEARIKEIIKNIMED